MGAHHPCAAVRRFSHSVFRFARMRRPRLDLRSFSAPPASFRSFSACFWPRTGSFRRPGLLSSLTASFSSPPASFSPVRPPFRRLSARFPALGVIFVQIRRKLRRELVSAPRKGHLGRAGLPARTVVSPSVARILSPATYVSCPLGSIGAAEEGNHTADREARIGKGPV